MAKSLRKLAAATGAALIATTALAAARPAQAAGPAKFGWPRELNSPLLRHSGVPDGAGELNGVFCTSTADCWAVGFRVGATGATLNQVLHWTGKKWFTVTVPEPAGTGKDDSNQLDAVRCTSASNCWAVGESQKGDGAKLDQILHWTGKKWFAVSAPTPAGTLPGDVNELFDVACTSAASCWAGGDYGTEDPTIFGETLKNQALRWNGKTWSVVPTPNPAGAKKNHGQAISSIRCASPDNCWAAGAYGVLGNKLIVFNEMLHWTGKKWTRVILPNPAGKTKGSFSELFGLSCTSAKSCLAVGTAEKLGPMGKAVNVVFGWNGTKWQRIAVPNPDGTAPGSLNELGSVNCAAARDCWAVGSFGGAKATSPAPRNQALHLTGTKWKVVSTPDPAGIKKNDSNRLNAIRCTGPANCWAVGFIDHNSKPDQDEALRWNGARWLSS
ncbi:MAG TPA: hypothetical protein VN767_25845 [Streptosporangiaceae bacterium]|jgi:hypothetical protein|nr:hypothetical protein [Streptosporangiaceae bacterium]